MEPCNNTNNTLYHYVLEVVENDEIFEYEQNQEGYINGFEYY